MIASNYSNGNWLLWAQALSSTCATYMYIVCLLQHNIKNKRAIIKNNIFQLALWANNSQSLLTQASEFSISPGFKKMLKDPFIHNVQSCSS